MVSKILFGKVAVSIFLAGWPSLCLAEDVISIVNEKVEKLAVFARPGASDADLIKTIAKIGAPQRVSFAAGANVKQYIASKCGQPTATIAVHPVFEGLFLARNSGLSAKDLESLPSRRTLIVPACAPFQEAPGAQPAPAGVEVLAANLGVPFNTSIFTKVVQDPQLRASVRREFAAYQTTGETHKLKQLTGTICNVSPGGLGTTNAVDKYFACSNAVEVAAANPQINNPNLVRFTEPVTVPVAAKLKGAETALAYIPIAEDSQSASGRTCVGTECSKSISSPLRSAGLVTITSTLRFVTEVDNIEDLGPDCADAPTLRHGSWPFDVSKFERAMSLSGIMDPVDSGATREPGRILIVDTGFDFSDGSRAGQKTAGLAFPLQYFHRLDKTADPLPNMDKNEDGVKGNGGWVGVNLSGLGTTSAETSIELDDAIRSHGLSVTALAMGGRFLEEFRRNAFLPIRVGEVSLVPLRTEVINLDPGLVTGALKFAAATGNKFNVINLSLASPVPIYGLSALLRDRGAGRVLVVAAGNDKRQLMDTTAVPQTQTTIGAWPALLGGPATTGDNSAGVFITVGAHNGKGALAKFSNWGSSVDILAPGCMTPSYQIDVDTRKGVVGLKAHDVSGTSFAAPLVSFAAALLMSTSSFSDLPGRVKARIQVASDYDPKLKTKTFSSGNLNLAKIVGFKYDLFDVREGDSGHNLRFGMLTNKLDGKQIECAGESLPFSTIKKIARGVDGGDLLIFSSDDDANPTRLSRHFCPASALGDFQFEFDDVETNERVVKDADEVWDYVAKL
jgi:hypothetical protein